MNSSDSYNTEFFKKLKSGKGSNIAIVASARKLVEAITGCLNGAKNSDLADGFHFTLKGVREPAKCLGL